MNKWFSVKTLVALSTSALLVACGGGGGSSGGSSGPVVSTDTFQLKTAYNNILWNTSPSSFTLSGSVIAAGSTYQVSGSGTVSRGSLLSSSFEGKPGYSKYYSTSGTVTVNGVTRPANASYTDYVDLNYVPLGMSGSSEYMVVTSANQVPVTAKVNDSGTWYQGNRYLNSSKITLLGTRVVSYAMLPDTANTAILSVVITDKDKQGKTTYTDTNRYRMTPAGVVTLLTEQAVIDDGSESSNVTATFR